MAALMGYTVTQPTDISLDGTDLGKPPDRNMFDQAIDRDDPYRVTNAFQCRYWGPWSDVNMDKRDNTKQDIMT